MILCWRHAKCLAIRNESEQRTFRTGEHLFDHYGVARGAEFARETRLNARACCVECFCDDNALARCKAIGLHHERRT